MTSLAPHGGDALGATPGHPLLTPALSGARDLSMSRQQALLDLQAIQRIPGLAGYWPADPAYLWEDSAGTIQASVNGVVGAVTAAAPIYTLGSEINTAPTTWTVPAETVNNGDGSYTFTATTAARAIQLTIGDYTGTMRISFTVSGYSAGYVNGIYHSTYTNPNFFGNGTCVSNWTSTGSGSIFYIQVPSGTTLTVSNISIKQVTSNNAYQSTTANKPYLRKTPQSGVYWLDSNTSTSALTVALSDTVLGRRNLLTYSEAFDNVTAWPHTIAGTGIAPIRTANAGVDPLGGNTADRIQLSLNGGTTASDYSGISQAITPITGTYTQSFYLKSYDANDYVISLVDGTGVYENITVTPTWQRFSRSATGTWQYSRLRLRGAQGTSDTADILVFGAQLELGATATNYQRIVSAPAYCTVARATAEGVTITENSEITPSYNIAPAFGFNADVAIFNRALTATEKALLTRYMQRSVPLLGPNLVPNGTFDTDTTGWSAENAATLSVDTGRMKIVYNGIIGAYAKQGVTTTSGQRYLLACSLIRGDTSGGIAARVYADNLGATNIYSSGFKKDNTSINSIFTASSATSYIWAILSATVNGTYDLADNISVKAIL